MTDIHTPFKGYNGTPLYLYEWLTDADAKGLVVIAHGMAELAGRYDTFARYLNRSGYHVFAADHRGHGRTAGANHLLGHIGKYGFDCITEDQRVLIESVKKRFPGLPVFALGHSFGSFIMQEVAIRYSRLIDGLILSGTAFNDGIDVRLGASLAALQKTIVGGNKPAKLLDRIAFSGNNDAFPETSDAAWLSRDDEAVRAYEADPYCGTLFPITFYHELFSAFSRLADPERQRMIRRDLPVFLFAGDEDPVGDHGKGVTKLRDRYLDTGLTDVTMTLYPGGRHEMLNEQNRDQVFQDVLNWLEVRNRGGSS
ncbi:alpha/beta hydrolase [Salisediminibacterium selenitireducens]|uniref:Alpha/beta hydrolase fold protein n=1 Tax=Bacillus selenitireducens (strain ATCC 700615 / DSM 15326 / MLS10) TaxID=439292 RepID=D6Y0H9_BACIE|nr:alpha/beta hydrolase [Salisediminibacterium selenitireducens]ADH98570.1 alpha/beta hydrolase fold protein [[Bacillus] selenitireducens MLS10]